MNRRGFLKGLLTASSAAVAAHFGAPEYMGDEIKRELLKDAQRTSVGFSDAKEFEPRPVWVSLDGTAKVWTDFVMKGRDEDKYMRQKVLGAARTLAKAIEKDLTQARADESKIIIQMPQVTDLPSGEVQLKAGAETKIDLFGRERYKVGFINEPVKIFTGE